MIRKKLFWTVLVIGLALLVLQDISSTVARKENRLVSSILIDPQNEPAPMENSVVGICQSTDLALPNPAPLDEDLSTAQVDAMTREAVGRAGGLADVIQPGDWVTIKVNILRFRGQGGYSVGVVSHIPVLVRVGVGSPIRGGGGHAVPAGGGGGGGGLS